MSDMSDEEFAEFMKKNKDRVIGYMKSEGLEFVGHAREEIKKGAKKANNKAKEAREFVVEAKEEFIGKDDKEDSDGNGEDEDDSKVKQFFTAVTSEEVQKHFIKMGMELYLGLSAVFDAIPKPDFVDKAAEKASEVRSNASKEYCANNKDCPKKKSSVKRIELE